MSTNALHASHIMFGLAGRPAQEGLVSHEGLCRMCSQPMTTGMVFSKWSGADFTDQNKVRRHDATHVCEACIWVHAWNCPPGYDVGDAKRGPSLRTYSHLWHNGEYQYASKGDKPAMRAFLRQPKTGPWFACIADTGQKHLIPYTPVNSSPKSSLVRFEEETVAIGYSFWRLADDIQHLLNEGMTKAEIESGSYRPKFAIPLLPQIHSFEESYSRMRKSAGFRLCLWLSQRDEEAYANRQSAKNRGPDGKPDPGDAKRVSPKRGKSAKSLGPDPGPVEVSNTSERRGEGLGNHPGPQPQFTFAEQGSLFGD